MPMKVPVKESITIPEGNHTGVIAEIGERVEPYHYIDVFVTIDDVESTSGEPVKLKEGFPAQISKNSKLGRLLARFGLSRDELESAYGSEMDLDKWLKPGTKVSYMTINKKTENGVFARIVEDSLKPIK